MDPWFHSSESNSFQLPPCFLSQRIARWDMHGLLSVAVKCSPQKCLPTSVGPAWQWKAIKWSAAKSDVERPASSGESKAAAEGTSCEDDERAKEQKGRISQMLECLSRATPRKDAG